MSYLSYSKIRFFLISILAIGVAYNLYFYREDLKMEKIVPRSFVVVEQYCRASKGSSSINIEYNGNLYSVRMANGECLKYPVGAEIKLIYNNTHDYFYKQDGLAKAGFRLFFFSLLLLLSIIPWDRLLKKKRK